MMPFDYEKYKTGSYDAYWIGLLKNEKIDEVFMASDGKIICKDGNSIYFAHNDRLKMVEKTRFSFIVIDRNDYLEQHPTIQTGDRGESLPNQIQITWNCHGSQILSVSVVQP